MKTSLSPFGIAGCEQLKAGSVLISRKQHTEELLNRSVILILEHDETGATGIILNKPCISTDETTGEEPLYYGGTYDTHRVGILLDSDRDTTHAVEICEGIYYSERCEILSSKNFRDAIKVSGLKAFIGFTVWQPGQLSAEIENNDWWVSEAQLKELTSMGNYAWEKMTFKAINSSQPVYSVFN
jgi:putative transcriptional regulator